MQPTTVDFQCFIYEANGLNIFSLSRKLTSSQNTERRSALRITREAELLGGELTTWHTRENLVIGAKFLRDDLPYFTELLGEVITKTKYSSALTNAGWEKLD